MIYLREITNKDILFINLWRNDRDIVDSLGTSFRFINYETDENWFSSYLNNRNANIRCTICLSETHEPIGVVYLLSIDRVSRTAEFAIMIGNKNYQGKGLGKTATDLMLTHAFQDMNLQRVYLSVLASNEKAFSMYKKFGFKHEGTMRKAVYKNGKYQDIIIMGLLREEYNYDKCLDNNGGRPWDTQ